MISQIAISKGGRGGRRKLPRVFTEHGAMMAANVLNSKLAVQASIMLIRVFAKLKEIAHEHTDLKKRLQALEQRVARGFTENEDELQEIRFLIAQLEHQPETKKRKIGF